ncbi:MAG TPA: helix-turn-helix transcriptional regulator [Streptosporangiaceae bacterium]
MGRRRTTAQELWGKELARARAAAGVTGRQLAEALNVVPSTVSQWESGSRCPHIEDVKRAEKLLGTNGYLAELLSVWVSREIPTEWTQKWLAIEARASTLYSFDLAVIPGLLQTESYARALLQFNRYGGIDIDERVRARLERQSIFSEGEPPTCVFVMDEYVLRRRVGTGHVMYEQLVALREAADRRDLFIHFVPLDAGSYAGLVGPFMIAKVNGREVAYEDGAVRGNVLESEDQLAALGRIWDDIRAAALPHTASVNLLEKEIERWTPR